MTDRIKKLQGLTASQGASLKVAAQQYSDASGGTSDDQMTFKDSSDPLMNQTGFRSTFDDFGAAGG